MLNESTQAVTNSNSQFGLPLVDRFATIHRQALEHFDRIRRKRNAERDADRVEVSFNPEDLVLIHYNPSAVHGSTKFQPRATGPHVIVKQLHNNVYLVKDRDSEAMQAVNVQRLSKFHEWSSNHLQSQLVPDYHKQDPLPMKRQVHRAVPKQLRLVTNDNILATTTLIKNNNQTLADKKKEIEAKMVVILKEEMQRQAEELRQQQLEKELKKNNNTQPRRQQPSRSSKQHNKQ